MNRSNSANATIVIILGLAVAAALIAGLAWANYRFVQDNPGGNDFLVHWVGTRAFLTEDISPYSDEVAVRIQTAAYGRPARAGEHELRVAYPLYASLIFAPFALIPDYEIARAAWMTVLELALLGLGVISLRLTDWRPGILMTALLLVFAVLWYHGLRPLINGNAVILVALLIGGAFLAIRAGLDELAGVLLALATIKPQVVVVLIPFVVLWAFTSGRPRLAVWSLGGVVLLTGLGMLFIPDWIVQNLREVMRYPGYNPPGTPGAVFVEWLPGVGEQLGWGLTILMAGMLAVEWWAARGKPFGWFLWTASLTLAASQWIGIQTDPGNFIVLLMPLMLIQAGLEGRWGRGMRIVNILILLGLLVGLWALFLATVQPGAQPQQHPIMFFPLPFVVLLGLYWIRWWVVQPRRPLLDALRAL